MHIWKDENGYNGTLKLGTAFKASCSGCKTFEEATEILLKNFI